MLFCDVVDSTVLGRKLEPLVTKRVLARYGDAVRRILGGSGASVGKRHGDGFMAAFGILELHEDDALRAVRAASEMRDGLAGLAEGSSVELVSRIGITTGEVLV